MTTEELRKQLAAFTEKSRILGIENDKLKSENDHLRQKLHPFLKIDESLSRCREEIVSRLNFGESVSLSVLLSNLSTITLTEVLHAVRLLEDRVEVDCSHHIEEESGLLDRITITRRA